MTDHSEDDWEEVNVDLSDENLAAFVAEAPGEVPDEARERCPQCRSTDLACRLALLDTRLNEHDAIAAFAARHGTSEKRRLDLFRQRSVIRAELSKILRELHAKGVSTEEFYNELPFLDRHNIASLLVNEP